MKLICIVGRGGIGKTALLCKVCEEIERGELRLSETSTAMGADGILYVSCRGTYKLRVEQLFHDVERMLGSPHAEELMNCWRDPSRSLGNKVRFLLSKLRAGCYLLMLDNFEYVLSPDNIIADADLREFVELCLTTPNALRLIATSQVRIALGGQGMKVARTVPLDDGLPTDDAIALLRDLDPDGEAGLKDAEEESLAIAAEETFGSPYALRHIAGILRDDTFAYSEFRTDPRGFTRTVMRDIVAEHYKRVTDDQRRVLEALAVLNKPVPAVALCYLLEPFFPNVDVNACLRTLVLNYFVTYQRGQDTYELHSLDQEYAYSCIPDDGDYTKRMLHHRAAEFCLSQLTGNERQDVEWQLQGWEHWFKAEEYEEAAKLTLVISRKLREWGRYAQLVDLYRATTRTARQYSPNLLAIAIDCLGMLGRMEEQEALLEESANSSEQRTRGLVLELTARYHADRGNSDAAISAAEESLSILLGLVKESAPHLREQLKFESMQAAHTVAWVFYQQGFYDEAIKRFEDAHCLMNELGAEDIIRPYQYYLADSLRMVGLQAEARSIMESRVLRMDEESIPPAAFMVWGQILQDEGDYEGAWHALQRSQTIAKRRSSPNALSRIEWVIGKWFLLNEQFNSALKCYLYARDLFDKWGWRPRFAMVQQEIGFVQHHLCNLPEARRYYEESLALDIPSINYSCAVRLGILCLEEGKTEEAQDYFARGIDLCRELLCRTPRLYDALYHLALAQLGIGQSDEALATYRKALEVCSAKGVVQGELQDLCLLKRTAQSVEDVEQAIRLLQEAAGGDGGEAE